MSADKILLISCYFPPVGGVQVQRALSLVRYLPDNGFQVHVLAARNTAVPTIDPSLLDLVPQSVHIHRSWSLEPPFHWRKKIWNRIKPVAPQSSSTAAPGLLSKARGWFVRQVSRILCPDPQVLWYPFAYSAARRLVRKEGIKVVIVTAPPFSSFLLIKRLKKEFPHIVAIADIRDEWLSYFVKEFAFRGESYVQRRAAEIERTTVQLCDRVVAVTETTRQHLIARYPDQPAAKFALVPNGYDPQAFSSFRSRQHNTGKLVITYTGTVYRPCSPANFLTALKQLAPEAANAIEVRFVGRVSEEHGATVFNQVPKSVRMLGFVSQRQAIAYMEETDILLLPWTDNLNIPGKLFEYLATGKPILALVNPGSEIEKIVHDTNAGWCANPEDIGAIASALMQILRHRGRYSNQPCRNAVSQFARPKLVAEYSNVIRQITGQRARSQSQSA